MAEVSSSKMKSSYLNSSPDMDVKIKGLEEDMSYYGKGIQTKCIQSSKSFIDYMGRTCGENQKQSLLNNKQVDNHQHHRAKVL